MSQILLPNALVAFCSYQQCVVLIRHYRDNESRLRVKKRIYKKASVLETTIEQHKVQLSNMAVLVSPSGKRCSGVSELCCTL